jgi:diguanylate cyclase (GGDEF)-like protein
MADETPQRGLEHIAGTSPAEVRKETRTIQILDYLIALCNKPLNGFYDFAVGCSTETIENMLKRVPSLNRDRETAQEALHSVLEHLHYVHEHIKDPATRDSAAKSAQNVLKLVVMNVSNTRDSVTYSKQMTDAYAQLQGLAKKHEAMEQEYRKLAFEDDLTGCYNGRYFRKQLPEEIAEANKYASPLSMIKFDLDHFKDINDKHGHPAGDYVLQELAKRVRGTVLRRPSDIFVRYGGDEFIVLLPEHDESKAKCIAEIIRQAVECMPLSHEGKQFHATTSIGVKQYNPADSREFWNLTDTCLYVAKRTGRNKVVAESDVRKMIRDNTFGREMMQKKVLEFDDTLYAYFSQLPGDASLKAPDASSPGGQTV